jgi:hypothetical protein
LLSIILRFLQVHRLKTPAQHTGSGLAGRNFTDPSWLNSSKNWAAFTALQTNPNFTSFTLNGSPNTSNAYGSFGYTLTGTGMNISWAPIPEPTSALAGILLVGGLLRRRR